MTSKRVGSELHGLIDAQSEACETIHWLDMSHACGYIDETSHQHYKNLTYEIQRMIEKIIFRH